MKKTPRSTPIKQPLKLNREHIRILGDRSPELVVVAAGVWTTDPSHSGCTSCA